jgi:hypothetical protein
MFTQIKELISIYRRATKYKTGWLLLEGGPWGEMQIEEGPPQWYRKAWHRIKALLFSWWWRRK